MKAQQYLLPTLIFLSISYLADCKAQIDANPDTSYNVHREYDKNGNLIYYDSIAVSTWNFDTTSTEIDSVLDAWEYGTPNHLHPFHYGFHIPGGPFGHIPELEFDFIIPDMHDFQEGFEYNFSITPSDSLYSPLFPDDPVYHQQHVVPPSDWDFDIDKQIYQMEKFIEEFNRRMDEQFNKPYHLEPNPLPNDTTGSPDINPDPNEDSYDESLIII